MCFAFLGLFALQPRAHSTRILWIHAVGSGGESRTYCPELWRALAGSYQQGKVLPSLKASSQSQAATEKTLPKGQSISCISNPGKHASNRSLAREVFICGLLGFMHIPQTPESRSTKGLLITDSQGVSCPGPEYSHAAKAWAGEMKPPLPSSPPHPRGPLALSWFAFHCWHKL